MALASERLNFQLLLASSNAQGTIWFAVLAFVVILAFILAIVLVRLRTPDQSIPESIRLLGPTQERYKQLVTTGQIIHLPSSVPIVPKGITHNTVAQVLEYTQMMRSISWGMNAPVLPDEALRRVFDEAVGRVRAIRADGKVLEELIAAFAAMPVPFCFIGAAELMMYLSYYNRSRYTPEGLIQALLFVIQAQCYSPLHPDALVTQVRILAAAHDPEWEYLAAKTLGILEQVAPQHPRIAAAQYAYFKSRREYEKALACCQVAQVVAPTQQERWEALKCVGDILLDMQRYPEAVIAYDAALAHDPNNEWTWHNKSIVLHRLGQPVAALACNERALSINEFGAARTFRQELERIVQARTLKPPDPVKWA